MPLVAWVAALLTATYVFKKIIKLRSTPPYPPGPRGLPFLRKVLKTPIEQDWVTYNKWSKKYGDIISFGAFGLRIVVINSAKIATDLFDRRSAVYSDRKEMVMLNELMGYDWTFGVNAYGDKWRRRRRNFRSQLHQGVSRVYEPIQMLEVRRFQQQLLDTPSDFIELSRGLLGATVMNLTYGIEVTGPHDPHITIADAASRDFSSAIFPGSFLVDYIPAVRYVPTWLPGTSFKQYAAAARLRSIHMRKTPMNLVKQGMLDGTGKPCLVSRMLSSMPEDCNVEEEEQLIEDSAGTVYQAGLETTVSAVVTFFLAMVLFPDAQKKAQEELDSVIGTERLPDASDRDRLPYIAALVSELWRWQPVTPLALPHATTSDDEYDGYLIPKGSTVLGNVWAMSRDLEDYPDPEQFRPERFLTIEDGKFVRNNHIRDPSSFAFGFGRRVCPGRHIAEQSVFATVILVLSTFKISPELNEHGKPIYPSVQMKSGLASHSKPFKCKIEPRSTRAVELIKAPLPDRGL